MSLAEQDDALIRAALDGSARAWDQLVRRHETQVYNFSLRLTGNPTDALDLMQEVFLGVYRNLHRFRGESRFSTWLFRIAHNKAIDMARRRPSSTSLESALQHGGDLVEARWQQLDDAPEQDPQALLDERQRNALIQAQMGALPLEQRLVVELKVFQSLTFEEIAELQDLSANTAKTRFYTALRRLKALMEQDHDM
jgi:RNA polymerase sigma-70 factor (ECF subfamily)